MDEGNRNSITADDFSFGIDEFYEYGNDIYETAKATHLAKAMDRIMAAADTGHTRLAVPFGLTLLGVLWLAAGMVMGIGGAR